MVEGSDGQNPQPDGKTPQSEGVNPQQRKLHRKVAKTLLEQVNPSANLQEVPPVQGDEALQARRRLKKISRTMLEMDIEKVANEALLHSKVDNPDKPDSDPVIPKPNQTGSGRYVAKTMLDHGMLFQAVSKSAEKMEQKAAEVAKERAKEPVETIEPIVAERKATKCQWSWTEPFNGKQRYRACSVCQAAVYDFEGLERAQAESIIFKHENLKKPKLYTRSDGKFMTRDCPRHVARKVQLIMLSALALVSIASIIIVLMLIPHARVVERADVPSESTKVDGKKTSSSGAETTAQTTTTPGATVGETTGETSGATTTSVAPGMFHYENGKITRPSAPAVQPTSPDKPVNNTVPDQNDQMWESSGAK